MRPSGEALIQNDSCHHNRRKFRWTNNRASHRRKAVRGRSKEAAIRKLRAKAAEDTAPADTLVLDSQPPELGEYKCPLLKPPCLWYFGMAAPASQYALWSQSGIHAVNAGICLSSPAFGESGQKLDGYQAVILPV